MVLCFNAAPYAVHVAALGTVEKVYVSQVFRYFRCFPSKEYPVFLEESSCIQRVRYTTFYLNLVSGQLIVESGVCGLYRHMGTFCPSTMKQIRMPLFTLTCRCRPLVCSFTEWLRFSITFVKAYNLNFSKFLIIAIIIILSRGTFRGS